MSAFPNNSTATTTPRVGYFLPRLPIPGSDSEDSLEHGWHAPPGAGHDNAHQERWPQPWDIDTSSMDGSAMDYDFDLPRDTAGVAWNPAVTPFLTTDLDDGDALWFDAAELLAAGVPPAPAYPAPAPFHLDITAHWTDSDGDDLVWLLGCLLEQQHSPHGGYQQ